MVAYSLKQDVIAQTWSNVPELNNSPRNNEP